MSSIASHPQTRAENLIMNSRRKQRDGAVAVLLCLLMLPLLALLAFSIDYGFLLYLRTDLQRVADQAALAAARDLTPDAYGNQDLQKVRDTVRQYVAKNLGADFDVQDADIEIGRYNPTTVYSSVDLLSTGVLDTVRVRLHRDDFANSSVSLYFARLFGDNQSDVSAYSTAVLQRARFLPPGTEILPIALEQKSWNQLWQGETASVYGDGRILDSSGKQIPGNWGTVDIGPTGNSTTQLSDQIRFGLDQSDLDSLHAQQVIPTPDYIDSSVPMTTNGDTGMSSGMRHAIEDAHGKMKVAPIYKKTTSHGGNLQFEIVAWVTVEIVDSGWNGSKNSYVEVRKSYTYDQYLRPVSDLSDTGSTIEGAYTSPVLLQ